ncbi:MAG: tetratricopeptide repeat protein [Ruminiclostridium sp.]
MIFGKFASQIYAIRASSAYQKGNTQETIALLDKAYKTGRAKASIVTTYGYILLKYGKLEEATKLFEEQLASTKLSSNERNDTKSNYALSLWKKGQLDEAISLFEEIITRYKNTNIYGSLGYLYNLKGDFEKALKFNLEAYDYNNANAVILDNLGQTYYLLGDLEKADDVFKKLMTLDPKFPEAFYDYALVLDKMGDKEHCIGKLRNALLYKPNYLSAITMEDIESKLTQMEHE